MYIYIVILATSPLQSIPPNEASPGYHPPFEEPEFPDPKENFKFPLKPFL